MTWIILGSVILGIIIGKLGLLATLIGNIDLISTIALNILLLGVGMDLGRNREVWFKLSKLGWKIILLPLGIAIGSLGGVSLIGLVLDLSVKNVLAVGAGFGWYSLSGVILKELGNIELGTVAFLANVFRELLAVFLIPIVASHLGKITAIAPGGATAMDTTLPLISRVTGPDIALLAFISGAVLSALVPILVPIFYSLGT